EKRAGVLLEDVAYLRLGVPAQAAPDHLVDVVVAALGIRDEADRTRLVMAKDRGLAPGTRVDDLAALGEREGHVPVGHGELALLTVCDVGIRADRIPRRRRLAELVDA